MVGRFLVEWVVPELVEPKLVEPKLAGPWGNSLGILGASYRSTTCNCELLELSVGQFRVVLFRVSSFSSCDIPGEKMKLVNGIIHVTRTSCLF